MNSKNTDDTPSASRTTLEDRSWRWQILSGIPRRNRGLTTTISGKWQSRIRGRRKSRYGGRFSCILSATFVSLLRIVIVKTVTVATPPPPPRSSLRASNARFHYRHPTSPARYCALYFARYADAGPCYAALHSAPRSVLTAQNFGNGLARSCPRPLFPLAL